MRFKDFLKESIIDIPRKTYARPVFDNADTSNPRLKPSVRKQILDGIKTFERFGKVVKYTLIGSILTKQYRDDADLDINILFDIPGSKAEQEKVHEKIREYQFTANGKVIPGTKHPINYFSIIDPALFTKAREMADGTYDIDKNEFIRKPEPGTFEPEKYVADFQKSVSEIDVVKGELVRDMIDYEELKGLTSKDINNLSGLVKKKLDEITDSINTLVDIGAKALEDRQGAFKADMSPDEIRKYGVKNRLPKNVIYKMLEKYHYLKFFKKLKEIIEDGKVTPAELKSLSKIKEAKGRSIAFTFGRFNPPTTGHEKLLNKLSSIRSDDYNVYLSRSEDSDKNPLSYRTKVSTMKQMFPRHARSIVVSPSNRVFDILVDLYKKKYTDVTMVVGSDRVREFETILKRYNDVKSRHGYYKFDNINIVSAGERDPDAEGATGMSASKMRAAAKKDDFNTFKKGLPSSFARSKGAEALFKDVKRGMNLAASYDPTDGALRFKPFLTASTKEELEKMTLRDKYISEHLYDIGDIVDDVDNKITGVIIRRGTNYVTLEDEDMKLHKAWLYNIMETPVYSVKLEARAMNLKEKRKLAYDKDTDQPKKYVAGLSDKDKEAHDRHLEKQGKKSDSDKSAYKQSPADKKAKTKPSVHTKRFKQMYGELKIKSEKEPEKRGFEFVDSGIPEAYEIGHDWAKYTSSITPGEKHYDPNYQGHAYKPSKHSDNLINVNADKELKPMNKKVELKDIEEWVSSSDTIDKYKERYGDEWENKIQEVYNKMFNKVIDTKENMLEGRMKDIAIDLMSKEKGGLDAEEFERKYGKSKAEMRKDLGGTNESTVRTFKEYSEQLDEWGIHPSEITEAEHQGKKVTLNKPVRGGSKKFYVYTKGPTGNVVKVSFGDPNMEIKRDNPARRRSFRARHNCDNPGPKWKARYWSCKKW